MHTRQNLSLEWVGVERKELWVWGQVAYLNP